MTTAAIQGEEGAFSHVAARQLFGEETAIVACQSFDDLFEAVVRGHADRGVVPVENTLAGSIPLNLDLLLESGLFVTAETAVRVELCLVVRPGRKPGRLRTAASHPVALQQCRRFFGEHDGLEPVTVYDTAGSVKDLMRGDADYDAAIGSALAAELYGGEVVERGIEDDPKNFTRFFAISAQPSEDPDGVGRAAVTFVVPHEPGSLHRALGFFANVAIDLTRLESRPIPGRPWEYRFFADLRGDPVRMHEALELLKAHAFEAKLLGVYPIDADAV